VGYFCILPYTFNSIYQTVYQQDQAGKRAFHCLAVKDVFNNVIALGAGFTALKLGPRYGISLPQAACLTGLFFPLASTYGIATYLAATALSSAVVEQRNHHSAGAVKKLALAAFAYITITPAYLIYNLTHYPFMEYPTASDVLKPVQCSYFPYPIQTVIDLISGKKISHHNKRATIDSIIATVAYVAAMKLAPRYGISFQEAACLTTFVSTQAFQFQVAASLLATALPEGFALARSWHLVSATQKLALAALAYLTLTSTYNHIMDKYVYGLFMPSDTKNV
jgi:hypothetical protein